MITIRLVLLFLIYGLQKTISYSFSNNKYFMMVNCVANMYIK